MPTKKVATKKVVNVEEIAAKTLDDISGDLITTQNKIRAAISAVGDALIAKKTEVDNLVQAKIVAEENLKEALNKEQLAMGIQELREEFDDAKHEQERKIKHLNQLYEDKMADLERTYQENVLSEKHRIEDENRTRGIRLEDEDRNIDLQFRAREAVLVSREKEVEEKEQELGSFDNRVEKEVSRQVKAAQISQNFEKQTVKHQAEAEIVILKSQVSQLEKLNQDLTSKLERAEDQVEAANNRANAIAIKSIEKESGKMALDKIEAIAQEQAKSGKK